VEDGEDIQTQNISIPADMVGCIIGRGGSKISEIRKSSGARISIAKAPHDESGERMFTITGGPNANEKALYLLYENLEAEKMRRSQGPEATA
jgi:heterogeneous nuclear rnp K-like protein 2